MTNIISFVAGQVSPEVNGSDGSLLLADDPDRRRHRHRDIVRVRRDEPDGVDRAGLARGRRRGHPGVVYMALVDILAEDFMSARVQSSARLQVALNTSLLLGAGVMSMLAIWA